MLEDHIKQLRNGCTVMEMAQIALPRKRQDPICSQLMPNFHVSASKTLRRHRAAGPSVKENLNEAETKLLPANHYIEDRFYAYNKAKLLNKPLFSKASELSSAQLPNRSNSSHKFHTSRYPNVPLGKELSSKVECINSFRETDKKFQKKTSQARPQSSISRTKRPDTSNKILLNLKSWERIKRENSTNFKVDSVMDLNKHTEKAGKRPKSQSVSRGVKTKSLRCEFVNTVESASSVLTPMAPVYAAARMVPQSPNLMMYPYTRYGHLFE
jgi:hypothetical protein